MYNIHLLPASFGDAILIEYGTTAPKFILIDGGPYYGLEEVLYGLKRHKVKTLELLVVTHIDIDHIDGIVRLLNQEKLPFKIKEIWFNGFAQLPEPPKSDILGTLQGEYLSLLIKRHRIPHNVAFGNMAVVVTDSQSPPKIKLEGGMVLTLLGPKLPALYKLRTIWEKEIAVIGDEEAIMERLKKDKHYQPIPSDTLGDKKVIHQDKSINNMSSIAFLATYEGKRCLFAGDLPTSQLTIAVDGLLKKEGGERLYVDAWKLAHHGSKRSTLPSLMQKIGTTKFLISTDGKRFKHPHKECISSLLDTLPEEGELYFNYLTEFTQPWTDKALQATKNFQAYYAENGSEITVKL